MAIKAKILLRVIALLPTCSRALLEERLVSFEPSRTCLDITRSDIVCASEDEVGIHIAAESLASDLEEITGVERSLLKTDNIHSVAEDTVIIAGSLDSSLIQHLSSTGLLDTSELQGKWESFVTQVIENPLPSVQRALVIAGSDKRGTIFGIYTLAEQCGQSPYATVFICSAPSLVSLGDTDRQTNLDITFGLMFQPRNTTTSVLPPRESFKANLVSSIEDSSSMMKSQL
jgi:hypothetical protein